MLTLEALDERSHSEDASVARQKGREAGYELRQVSGEPLFAFETGS